MPQLSVGYAKVDVTPRHSVPLSGYNNEATRYSDNVLDPLYATCLAFSDDEGSTALLIGLDSLHAAPWMRQAVSEATGLPLERVHVSGSHSHAAPLCLLGSGLPGADEHLLGTLKPGLIDAAQKALADRKPAQAYVTQTQTMGLNFVRNYLMEDGTWAGPNFGNQNQPYVAHESEADGQLQLVKFVREGGKDVVVANFGVHQTRTGGVKKHNVSADSFGAMRAKLELELDCRVAYFYAVGGNLASTSKIKTEPYAKDHVEHGRALADYALAANDTYRPVSTGPVRVKALPLELEVNHCLDHLADAARAIVRVWNDTGDRVRCKDMAKQAGMNSVYHAISVLDKLALGKTYDLEIAAISLGDVAFAVAPYEMYDTNGKQIKEGAPHALTVIATCANEYRSYLPSALGFEHGGYTVDRCRFVPGTGERVAREYISLLEELHEA